MERALAGKIAPGHRRKALIRANGDGLYD
jgi:hypothetical protein